MNKFKAAIFDLDGTLIDSMGIWKVIDEEYLNKYGFDVPENLQEEITHLTIIETAMYFKEKFNIKDDIETIINTWNDMAYSHYSNTIKLKEGVIEFLYYLKSNNIKIGLATSNTQPLLEATLKNNNIYDYFDSITISEEVGVSKANPDIYLLSAQKLNVDPKDCIVFEDIVQAVKGAKLAGMTVYSIYDESSAYQKDELIKVSDKYILNYLELIK